MSSGLGGISPEAYERATTRSVSVLTCPASSNTVTLPALAPAISANQVLVPLNSPLYRVKSQIPILQSRGETAPSANLLTEAMQLERLLGAYKLPPATNIGIGPTGCISFSWMANYPDREVHLNLYEDEENGVAADWVVSGKEITPLSSTTTGTLQIVGAVSAIFVIA